jgi:23S rRNA (pseudouridine1915-N3)-methyltransferase
MQRISRYVQTQSHELPAETALFKLADRAAGRTAPVLILLDARGRQFTSEEFAELLRDQQDRGTQNLLFAIGPSDGFSDQARHAADLILSFGKMTLAHELARVVLLEQIYRAFTILKGHPYHTGH